MKPTPQSRQRAVTLTELLVVLVIISILSTIALPVYINYSERARVATAQMEVSELGQAMQSCALEHGLFVPLQVLDDLQGVNAVTQSVQADAIQTDLQLQTIDFNVPFLTMNSVTANHAMISTSLDPRTRNLVLTWKGPFMTFQRTYIPPTLAVNQPNYQDYPLDPWGNPYRFYSPIGIIGASSTVSTTGVYNIGDFDGLLTTVDQRFDRWTIVSWGPDGISDSLNGYVNRDDVVYSFGTTLASSTAVSATPSPTP